MDMLRVELLVPRHPLPQGLLLHRPLAQRCLLRRRLLFRNRIPLLGHFCQLATDRRELPLEIPLHVVVLHERWRDESVCEHTELRMAQSEFRSHLIYARHFRLERRVEVLKARQSDTVARIPSIGPLLRIRSFGHLARIRSFGHLLLVVEVSNVGHLIVIIVNVSAPPRRSTRPTQSTRRCRNERCGRSRRLSRLVCDAACDTSPPGEGRRCVHVGGGTVRVAQIGHLSCCSRPCLLERRPVAGRCGSAVS